MLTGEVPVPDHDKLLEAISKSKAGLEDPHVKAIIEKNLRRKNERSVITSADQRADSVRSIRG